MKKDAATQAGLPPQARHGVRHTNATLLILAGVSVNVVSMRLGQSTVKITLDHYVHPDSVAGRAAASTRARPFEDPL